jgi:hypothetical protein
MLTCPACNTEIDPREIVDRFSLKPYVTCPHCQIPITVDSATKRRQALAIVVAVVSLILTVGWCFMNKAWFVASIASYVVLVGWIAWSNPRVHYVIYRS